MDYDDDSTSPAEPEFQLTILYLISGISAVLGVCMISVLCNLVYERLCRVFRQEEMTPQQMVAWTSAPLVIRQAGLGLLSIEERIRILDYLFTKSSYLYTSETNDSKKIEEIDLEAYNRKESVDASCNNEDDLNKFEAIKHKLLHFLGGKAHDNHQLQEKSPRRKEKQQEEQEEGQSNRPQRDSFSSATVETEVLERIDDDCCAICLCEYADGEKVISGKSCSHIFHNDCSYEWMKKGKFHCPFCRELMFQSEQWKNAAKIVLGDERVDELFQLSERYLSKDNKSAEA